MTCAQTLSPVVRPVVRPFVRRCQGFHFSRPPVGTPGEGVRLRPDRRTPFIPMDPQQRPEAWNYGCVLTTGGPAIVGDEMCKCKPNIRLLHAACAVFANFL